MNTGELGKVYKNGETICREGEQGTSMYVVQTGKVKVTKKSPGGEVFLRTLEGGDFFGEMALFSDLPRSATVTADGETRILTIDKQRFFATISEDASLAFMIIEGMCRRIENLTSELSRFKKEKDGFLDAF